MQEKYKHLAHQPGMHREYIGGVGDLWDTIGDLQFEMLKTSGMQPSSKLLDLGCGSLRLGVRAIPFLHSGNYYGLDMHQSLIDAGVAQELGQQLFLEKQPHLIANDAFNVASFGTTFDFIVAQSLFTHLPIQTIEQCILSVAPVMHSQTKFFFTFYELTQDTPAQKIDEEPYHQPWMFYESLAVSNNLRATYIGEWGHPRGQRLGMFELC